MSLYDDIATDYDLLAPIANTTPAPAAQPEPTNNWNNNSLKFLQCQVEAAKKRQKLNSASHSAAAIKRDKPVTVITPVVNLSSDLNKTKQLPSARKENQEPTTQLFNPPPSLNQTSYYSSNTPELRFNSTTGKIERDDSNSLYGSNNEEYDPMRPNDYEKLVLEMRKNNSNKSEKESSSSRRERSSSGSRDRSRHDRDRSRSRSRRDRSRSRNRRRRSKDKYENDDDDYKRRRSSSDRRRSDRARRSSHNSSDDEKSNHSGSGSNSNSDDSKKKRKNDDDILSPLYNQNKRASFPPVPFIEDKQDNGGEDGSLSKPSIKPVSDGMLKAEKMMAKMGYKEGEGLGRNKQGMSVALQVEKTGIRSGRIIHEKELLEQQQQAALAPPLPKVELPPPAPVAVGIPNEVMKNMSKVILLRNMVAPGDVDNDLEAETKEECQKYGEVNKCVIYEIPNVIPEEAVRIFIEFKSLPSAIKALTDLNGRFFGGRKVKATFYNLDKFTRLELSEPA